MAERLTEEFPLLNESLKDSMIQSSPVAMLVLDLQGRIVFFNPLSIQILQLKGDLKGHFLEEFCPKEGDGMILFDLLSGALPSPQTITLRTAMANDIPVRIRVSRTSSGMIVYLQDNSEILTLEQELRSFKTAIYSAADAIILFEKNGMIFFANPAFEEQVGLTQEHILGQEIQCFWSDLDPPNVHREIGNCLQNNWPWSGEMTWVHGDRTPYHVEVRMTPILMETGRVVGYICVMRDISERKKIEKKLVEYSDNLERLVEERTKDLSNLHDITQLFHSTKTLEKRLRLLLISATAGEVFRFNRAFLLLIDKGSKRLNGRLAFGPSSPEEAGMIWKRVEQIPRKESLTDTLRAYLDHSGEGERRANQIVKELGVPLSYEFSILVQAIKAGSAFVVRDGQTDVPFDPVIIQQLGTHHFAVVPLMVQAEPLGVLVVDNIITHRLCGEEDIQLLEILAAQASLAIAHAGAMEQLDKKMQETEAAYARLRASQEKLIEASKFAALGQMAATVAHEIRTPLVAIGGFINLLLRKRTEDDKEYTHLKIVRDEALRLEDVLNRLLFYARPSTPQKEKQNLHHLMDSVLSLLESELKDHQIAVVKQYDPSQQWGVFDRNLMRQVFMNLLQNSIQSMENGGKIVVETGVENHNTRIRIADTGQGIAPENLKRIFEPFFSTKHAGTGLGMHVSQRIVQSHGGRIEVQSRRGEGTIVTVFLPMIQEGPDEKNPDYRR